MKTRGDIIAIILAAGESKRMNKPKMLLPFKGKTIIETVIDNVMASEVDGSIVVVGADKEAVLEVISGLAAIHVNNDNYREGMLSSVKCGFRAMPDDIEAVIVFQGDQPMISSSVVNTIIFAYRKSRKGIIIPVYDGKRGHPILIDGKYRDEVINLNADEGLRSLSVKNCDDVLEVSVNEPEILRDIDTIEDYLYEINQTC